MTKKVKSPKLDQLKKDIEEKMKDFKEGQYYEILRLIEKHDGNVHAVAKEIGLPSYHIMWYFRYHKNIWEYLVQYRHLHNEILCDAAVTVLTQIIDDKKSSPALALKASMYLLDRLGKERGYTQTINVTNNAAKMIDNQHEAITIAYDEVKPNENNNVPDADPGIQRIDSKN